MPAGSAVKETLAGRRKRLREALAVLVAPVGWKMVRANVFEKPGESEMSTRLWKVRESTMFGNWTLIQFLEKHGAEMETKSVLAVPASAFKAALANPKDAGLSEEADIDFIMNELAEMDTDASDKDEENDEEAVDLYDIG